MASSGDYVLDINDLGEVEQTCQQFSANHWEEIGSILGIKKTRSTESMSNMLSSWLQRKNPLPTWKILCDAIATVDRTAAEKIAADKGFSITRTDLQSEEEKTIPGMKQENHSPELEDALAHINFNQPKVSNYSDPVGINPTQLRECIRDRNRTVDVSPIMLIMDNSKSEALIKQFIPESRNDAMTNMSESKGISCHELVAPTSLTHSEVTKQTCYQPASQSALKHIYYGQEIKFLDSSAEKREIVFDDEDLNRHFYTVFDSLAEDQKRELSTPLSDTKWNGSIPNGIALINIWGIGMNKAVYHFLPALWGHLDNSYVWLFLDPDLDVKDLYNTPSLPENNKSKDKIVEYRSRMEYLLHPAMLAKSSSDEDRLDVCSVFGVHSGEWEKRQLDNLIEHIRNASAQANLATVINTEEVTPINPKDDKCWEVLKGKADKIIGEELESAKKVPLASIFLRSLYYGLDKMYIKKSELKAKAKLLSITDDEFERFCKVFTSFGSIIDVSLIDTRSDYVILQPTVFIRCLDKIFYPDTIDSKVAMCGIVTKSTAMEIFNTDYEFFIDVLVSVDLAITLNINQITSESSEFPLVDKNAQEEYYYLPDVRTSPPDLECHCYALHLLCSPISPLRHLQVLFTRALLQIKPETKLVFKEKHPINTTTFKIISRDTQKPMDFDMIYFGEAVEFVVPETADKDICEAIIKSCHQMMKSKWGCMKYNFAVMCSNYPSESGIHQMRHFLPDNKLCEACKNDGKLDQMSIWNAVLEKYPVKEERKLMGAPIIFKDIIYITEKLQNDVIQRDTLNKIAIKLSLKAGLDNDCLNNIDPSCIPSKMIYEWDDSTCIGQFGSNGPSDRGESKLVLAQLIMEVADSIEDIKQKDILEILVRRLDMYYKIHHGNLEKSRDSLSQELLLSKKEIKSLRKENKDLKNQLHSQPGIDRSHADTTQVVKCIKRVIQKYYPNLSELFAITMETVAREMYAVSLIPHAVERNATFKAIMDCFLSGFAFTLKLEDVEKHCEKFLKVFYQIGGQFVNAANIIKQTIQETVRDELGVQLNINL